MLQRWLPLAALPYAAEAIVWRWHALAALLALFVALRLLLRR